MPSKAGNLYDDCNIGMSENEYKPVKIEWAAERLRNEINHFSSAQSLPSSLSSYFLYSYNLSGYNTSKIKALVNFKFKAMNLQAVQQGDFYYENLRVRTRTHSLLRSWRQDVDLFSRKTRGPSTS